jgi:hypothetical protein
MDQFYKDLLHKNILAIVDEASGGIKFTELVCKLTELSCKNPELYAGYGHDSVNWIEDIEEVCRASHVLEVLDYISKTMNRSKMFVYTV